MAANSSNPGFEPFCLFSSEEDKKGNPGLGLGFFDDPQESLPPPPPSIEVLSSETASSAKHNLEVVNFGELTLLKGRVSTRELFSLSNSDLVPGKYEGGLKLWEGSLDLVRALQSEIRNGHLSFTGKRVLELGCGHGLPGIFACLEGAAAVHFQDFNAEVLKCLTIPNVSANISNKYKSLSIDTGGGTRPEARFFSGDWSEVHKILPHVVDSRKEPNGDFDQTDGAGYDVILMAETVYSVSALQNLYELTKKCLRRPHGVVYVAGKKHYFGVGGGTRRFLSVVDKDGIMSYKLTSEVADGASNVREVMKLSFK